MSKAGFGVCLEIDVGYMLLDLILIVNKVILLVACRLADMPPIVSNLP